MKVAMVTQSYYPSLGGVTEHVHFLCKALRNLGHDVTVITAGPQRSSEASTIRIGVNAVFPINGAFVNVTLAINIAARLERELKTGCFDLVHIHCPLEPTLPLAALRASMSIDLPVVGTFHMSACRSPAYDVFGDLLQRYARRLDSRIAVSRAARRFAMKYFPGSYSLIPNGVDFTRFASPTASTCRLEDAKVRFLYVGRLDMRKNVPSLIAAFRRHRADHPDSQLIIVGSGFMDPVCRLAAGRLAGKSILFRGSVSPPDLPAYYHACDVFCSVPTGSESFGIVLLEAMAAGRPVICTDIDGYREIVSDGVDGLLVPAGDTRALADAMTRLALDRKRRLAMGAQGQQTARSFDWCRIAARVSKVYEDLGSRPVYRGTCDGATSGVIRLP